MRFLFPAAFWMLSAALALGATDKTQLDSRIQRLSLQFELLRQNPEKAISVDALRAARGIILLDCAKGGLVFGFESGGGVAMVRDLPTGQWSPPAFLSVAEASFGLQLGGQRSFVVILLMNSDAVAQLLRPATQFGGEAGGTAGRASAQADSTIVKYFDDIQVYDNRHGFFGGAAIKTDSLAFDAEANRLYYGQPLSARELLFEQRAKPSPAALELTRRIFGQTPPRMVLVPRPGYAPPAWAIRPPSTSSPGETSLLAAIPMPPFTPRARSTAPSAESILEKYFRTPETLLGPALTLNAAPPTNNLSRRPNSSSGLVERVPDDKLSRASAAPQAPSIQGPLVFTQTQIALAQPNPMPPRPNSNSSPPQASFSSASDAASRQLSLLLDALNANHQTNALNYLNNYLSAMVAMQCSADADTTIGVLQRLRASQTREAIESLETRLDGALIDLGDVLAAMPVNQRQSDALSTLDHARAYRKRFPRWTSRPDIDSAVSRALNLSKPEQ